MLLKRASQAVLPKQLSSSMEPYRGRTKSSPETQGEDSVDRKSKNVWKNIKPH